MKDQAIAASSKYLQDVDKTVDNSGTASCRDGRTYL